MVPTLRQRPFTLWADSSALIGLNLLFQRKWQFKSVEKNCNDNAIRVLSG